MKRQDLTDRTKRFALAVIHVARGLSHSGPDGAVARQLVESGTRVGADCRACARAASGTEFAQRVLTLADRTDEALFWIELVLQSGMASGPEVADLLDEAKQLKAIMAASAKTVRRNSNVAVNRQ